MKGQNLIQKISVKRQIYHRTANVKDYRLISEMYFPWFITDAGGRKSNTILFQYI